MISEIFEHLTNPSLDSFIKQHSDIEWSRV